MTRTLELMSEYTATASLLISLTFLTLAGVEFYVISLLH